MIKTIVPSPMYIGDLPGSERNGWLRYQGPEHREQNRTPAAVASAA